MKARTRLLAFSAVLCHNTLSTHLTQSLPASHRVAVENREGLSRSYEWSGRRNLIELTGPGLRPGLDGRGTAGEIMPYAGISIASGRSPATPAVLGEPPCIRPAFF